MTHKKNIIVSIILLLLFSFFLPSCYLQSPDRLHKVNISFAVQQKIDFGDVFRGDSKNQILKIKNTGVVPLKFRGSSVKNAMGPAALSFSPQSFNIAVGKTKIIHLRLRADLQEKDSPNTEQYSSLLLLKNTAEHKKGITITAHIVSRPNCDDNNPCTLDILTGDTCKHVELTDGSSCDDQNACTVHNQCQSGQCVGETLECRDAQECTVDSCDKDIGCVFTEDDTRCESSDVCQQASCSAIFGCQEAPKENGTLCSFNGCEEIGLCLFGSCHKQQAPDGFPCEDGDICTKDDTCQQGACKSGIKIEFAPQPSEILVQGKQIFNADSLLWAENDDEFSSQYEVSPEKVLATSQLQDGRFRVIWQSQYVVHNPEDPSQNSVSCDWKAFNRHDFIDLEQCISALYISDLMPNKTVRTKQIAITAGAAAAEIEKSHSDFGTQNIAVVVSAPNHSDIFIAHYTPTNANNYQTDTWNPQNISYQYQDFNASKIEDFAITLSRQKTSILGHWQFLEHFENSTTNDSQIITQAPMFLLHYRSNTDFLENTPDLKHIALKGYSYDQIGTDLYNIDETATFFSRKMTIHYDSKHTLHQSDDRLHISILSPEESSISGEDSYFTPYITTLLLSTLESNLESENDDFLLIEPSQLTALTSSQDSSEELYAFESSADNQHNMAFQINYEENFEPTLTAVTMKYTPLDHQLLETKRRIFSLSHALSQNIIASIDNFEDDNYGISSVQTSKQNYQYIQSAEQHSLFSVTGQTSIKLQKPLSQSWEFSTNDHKNGMNIIASHISTISQLSNDSTAVTKSAIEIQRFSCEE